MNIKKEIESYLNSKIDLYKKALIEEISLVIGKDIGKYIDKFAPVYIAEKSNLGMTLEIDDLNRYDRQFIEQLLIELEEKDKIYIGHYGKVLEEVAKNFVDSSKPFIVCLDNNKEIGAFLYQQNIYQGSYSVDISYIVNLLLFLGLVRKENVFYPSTSDVSLDLDIPAAHVLIYTEILSNLVIMIVYNLHIQNIYLFDNKSLIMSNEELKFSLPEYFEYFYHLFKDIISILLFDYKEFVNIVGKSNFEDFTVKVLYGDMENIDEILERMNDHKVEYVKNSNNNHDRINSLKYKKIRGK